MTAILWPRYDSPGDLADIERIPLEERGLPATTYEVLVRAAQLWPNRAATTVLADAAHWEEPVSRTFAALLGEVHQGANLLHSLGVRRSDAVTLLAPNCADIITATLAAELAGVAAPVNPGLSSDHISELLRRSGAKVLIAAGPELDPGVYETACQLARQGVVDAILFLRPTGSTCEAPALATDIDAEYFQVAMADQPRDRFLGEPPVASDLASMFHTGGTTGIPKLAGHTHANEVADAWMIAANTVIDEDSTIFAALPLFHVNALIVTLIAPLFRGQRVLWAGPLGYRDLDLYTCFWRLVERYEIAAMSAVPTVYSVLAMCPVDADISSLKVAMVGASALPQAVREGFETHTGVELLEGYGLTEATCASARSFTGFQRAGSVGQRFPYQQMKTIEVGPDGAWRDLPIGEVGVLAIAGPTVFPGYVTGRDENGPIFDGLGKLVDGWLDTGDLARLDEDGFVYLTGRAKDLIIRGGHNIDPAVIEDALLSHPEVTGALAVGRPDKHAGEVPVAYVTLAPEASVDAEQLLAWARERITEQAASPKNIVVRDSLPVTDVGKPYKLALRACATDDAVRAELHGVPGVAEVRTEIHDGATLSVVNVTSPEAAPTVDARLAQYAIAWRIEAPQ